MSKVNYGSFECALCHKTFDKLLSPEDQLAQYNREFPAMPFHEDDCEEVCDDCYQKMNREIPTAEWSKNQDNWTAEQKKRWGLNWDAFSSTELRIDGTKAGQIIGSEMGDIEKDEDNEN